MNDILTALKKERSTLGDRCHIINVCLKRAKEGKGHECIADKTYTDEDLQTQNDRLEEVEIAIQAIASHRKNKKNK